MDAKIERVARAIFAAEGCDPDALGYGMGLKMPEGDVFPLWQARIPQAAAAIKECDRI